MKKFEQQLADLEVLSQSPVTPEMTAALRKAIGSRNNYLCGKAAAVAARVGVRDVIPELLTAFDRFFLDPVKTDPQCWGKNGVASALAELGHDEPEPFVRGLRHVQMEPVWGGQSDTAGPLRARCALALAGCRSLSDTRVLSYLLEALVDRDKTVRVEAARAIARIDRSDAALLLRLRALTGDEEPEVVGACLSGVLSLEGDDAIDFVTRILDGGGETGGEAALSLGMTHSARAFEVLKDRVEHGKDRSLLPVLLTAIALTRLPEAFALLTSLVASAPAGQAAAARQAIESVRPPEEVLRAVQEAAAGRE